MNETNMKVGFGPGRQGTSGLHGLYNPNRTLQKRVQAQPVGRSQDCLKLTEKELQEEIDAIQSGKTHSF